MVLAKERVIEERAMARSDGQGVSEEIQRFQQLIDQLTISGWLTRRDEEAILAALNDGLAFSSEKCAIFRQLQERVWRAEVHLEPS
jgi:hypothetical protein